MNTMNLSIIPVATYRIQFSLNFRFVDAWHLVPYLHDLGVTHLYASPQFKAGKGSSHGYDVADPQRINSELGTEEEFDDLVRRLKDYGMELLLDIVPNHMVASSENPWWMDLLENGPASEYVSYFDINWHPATTKAAFLQENKVLLPVLGDLYGTILENQELTLKFDEKGFYVSYYDHRFPLNARSYHPILEYCLSALRVVEDIDAATLERFAGVLNAVSGMPGEDEAGRENNSRQKQATKWIKQQMWGMYHHAPSVKRCLAETLRYFNGIRGDTKSFEPLHQLLSNQAYRLAYWKMAAEEINYRRFFDINDLVGLRVEDPKVFYDRHREIIELARKNEVAGLRIDYIDGLYDPLQYLKGLQSAINPGSGQGAADSYIVVEKILGRNEWLPEDWPVAGTTGYDFLNALNGIFVDQAGFNKLEAAYRRFTGSDTSFAELCYGSNKRVMAQLFAGEVHTLGNSLGKLAAQDRHARDLPLSELIHALVEVTARLPVYRTYVRDFAISARDRSYLDRTVEVARLRSPRTQVSNAAFDFLHQVLLVNPPYYAEDSRPAWLRFVMQWQQFSGPVMAKGLEDTASYAYNSLTSLNEVGSDSIREEPPFDLDAFHAFNQERLARWPHTLNATSTHDTKRSEDVRARINVLSELHEAWRLRLLRWSRWNRSKKERVRGQTVPDSNEEVLLYQTMLGAWPLDGSQRAEFLERLVAFMWKALREAKIHTNWIEADQEYEAGMETFIRRIFDCTEENQFFDDFLALQKKSAFYGCFNALAQILLKIMAPGVPDFYQGTESWDFSLVDPDNRRPIDFQKHIRLLDDLKAREAENLEAMLQDLMQNWQDGRIKLYMICKALNFRRTQRELFTNGDYLPLYALDRKRETVCAFARRRGPQWALTAVPRLITTIVDPGQPPVGIEAWKAGKLALPREFPDQWHNVLTNEGVRTRPAGREKTLALANVFRMFPVALLVSDTQ